MFRVCSFDSETFQDDIFNLDIKFRYFSKKLEMRFLQLICLLAQKIPLFLPESSDMVKPTLELERVDLGDTFTYLSCSHIMSTSNFRIREKKFSKFIFYAYFLKEYFKEPVQKLFSAQWRDFFQKIKITIYVAQNLILTNETPLKSMILNKFSFGSFGFGGRNAKIIKKYRAYWFWLGPLRIASNEALRKGGIPDPSWCVVLSEFVFPASKMLNL